MKRFSKMYKAYLLWALIPIICFPVLTKADDPKLNDIDRTRLREASLQAEAVFDSIWPVALKAPMAILLVTEENEFLINHPTPSDDFKPLGYDSLLHSEIHFRPTVFPTSFLATFPAVTGLSTIVVGRAENTQSETSTRWMVTLLHEHFHQLQTTQPGYYEAVNALDLHGGDQTGMWMLNYAFPYDSLQISTQFAKLASSLSAAILSRGTAQFEIDAKTYLTERKDFRSLLGEKDYRYFAFQLWQEGLARHTEYSCAVEAARRSTLSDEFKKLDYFLQVNEVAQSLLNYALEDLQNPDLSNSRRVAFYSVGFGEGLLLDELQPNWRLDYFSSRFDAIALFPDDLTDK